ncbi:MAG: DNA methyltransferase [Patescibacteria group bacterium]|nr:hypothetical protein [Patescibacteria group bacterium]
MSYIFLLGRKERLSIAELRSRLGNIEPLSQQAALFNGKLPDDPQKFLDSLGGTVKICEVIEETSDVRKSVEKFLQNHFKDATSKINYGLSLYKLAHGHEIFLKNLLKDSKKSLQEAGIKARFVNKDFKNVANTAIQDSGLLRHGVELCTFLDKKKYLTKTVAAQDFKSYGFRDYERPARDSKSGMLPPKLAQMMINLSGAKPGQKIWDPFCGSGTVLMEGLLMGMNVIGSDINGKAVKDSDKNLKWLDHHFKFNGEWEVLEHDACNTLDGIKPDVIITETYLGPALFKFPGEQNTKKCLSEVGEIVYEFLQNLEQKCPIVLAIPFIRSKQKNFHIENFVEKVQELGYSVPALDEQNKSLLYDRPEQIVGREIFKLEHA